MHFVKLIFAQTPGDARKKFFENFLYYGAGMG